MLEKEDVLGDVGYFSSSLYCPVILCVWLKLQKTYHATETIPAMIMNLNADCFHALLGLSKETL